MKIFKGYFFLKRYGWWKLPITGMKRVPDNFSIWKEMKNYQRLKLMPDDMAQQFLII